MKKGKEKSNSGGEFILEIFGMMNKPTEFFNHDLSITRGMFYFILTDFIFTAMTQTMVFYKLIPATFQTTFAMSIVINFLSIIAGFCLIAAIMLGINLFLGGKNQVQLFSVLLYSITPALLFVWIPFIFVQFIVLLWSLALIMIGIGKKENFSHKKSLVFPVVFITLVFLFTYLSRNYIFLGFLK
jgi:hypothetical protein